jgi:hypothetical protein
MKLIVFNVVGAPTDQPLLMVDNDPIAYQADLDSEPGHALVTLPAWVASGVGASMFYADTYVRVLTPPPGRFEANLPPVRPPDAVGEIVLTYAPAAPAGLRVVGADFFLGADRWPWKGCTDFRLAQRLMAGEDIRPQLLERRAVGANLVRVLAMKTNNTGWDLIPQRRPDYFGDVRRVFDAIGGARLCCEWTVFADTAAVMPDASEQDGFWQQTVAIARDYPFVLLELVNEWNHPTQRLDPQRFAWPRDVLASHGSGLTDADVVRPCWDYATYHARRRVSSIDARGAANYSPYIYQENYPKACPFIPDEGEKPENYGFDVRFARLIGQHAACGAGGTFHWSGGIDSRQMTDDERACASAFFEAIG